MSLKPIQILIETDVTGEDDVGKLASTLDELAKTLDGELKVQAQQAAQALRDLGAKRGAIDNFVKLKGEASDAAVKLGEAQAAAQKLGQALKTGAASTSAQSGQMEKLRDAVRVAKNELQEKTRAVDNSRGVLRAYGIAAGGVAKAEIETRQAVTQVRSEVAKLAPAYTAAGSAAAAASNKQVVSAKAANTELKDVGQTLRTIQSIAITAVGGTFLTSMARDVGDVADGYKGLRTQIALVSGDGQAMEEAFAAVRRVALDTNTSLESTVKLYSRVLKAGKEVGLSQKDALRVTEIINKAIQVGGVSAASADAAITQLIQGLQSGVVRGEEFNSLMESGSPLAEALAKSLGKTTGELRVMANQGLLTTEVVLKGFLRQGEEVDGLFAKLPKRIQDALTNLSTQWTNYIGTVDQVSGASAAASAAINGVANSLDEIAGMAARAGTVLAAAIAIQAAGAVRAYMAEVTLATGATKLLALQMSALPKTLQITVAFTGFEIGYQIGEMLRDNSEYARKLGVATVAFIQGNIEVLRLLKESAAAVFTDDTIEAATARFNLRIAETKATLESMWVDAEQAPSAIEAAASKAASAVAQVGIAAADASKKVLITAQDTTEAFQAAALAKVGDAQAGEANLRVQLQLARQSEEMARFMGDEKAAREAKIQQMQIEIQLVQARANVARVEAEGSIAVANAKLAEMKASGEVNLVKQAEIENSIKLAQAKVAEADATGKSTELMQKQLDAFRKAIAMGGGFGSTLDDLTNRQRRLAGATREATDALEEQAAASGKYSSPLGSDKYSTPKGGSVTGNTREERLAGQSATDESMRFELLAKLQQGTLTKEDLPALRAMVDTIKTNQAIFDSLPVGLASLSGLADDKKWAAARTGFEQAISTLGGGSGPGAATVGRRYVHDIRLDTNPYPVTTHDDESASNLETIIAQLTRDKRRAM